MDWGESVEEGLGGQDKDGVRRWGRCGDDDFGESLERPRGRRLEGGGEKRAVKEKEWRRISGMDGKVERIEGCGAAVWQDRPSRMGWKMVANIWGVRGRQPPWQEGGVEMKGGLGLLDGQMGGGETSGLGWVGVETY